MNYPKRGEMSDDGRFYTHTDGTVWAYLGQPTPNRTKCAVCKWRARGDKCGAVRPHGCNYRHIEGAYVPSAEEREACDMARAMIVKCGGPESTRCLYYGGGYLCDDITNKTCPARAYLAAHGDANAWETNG